MGLHPRGPNVSFLRWQVRGAIMGMIKLLTAPIRSIVRFPLVQLAFVIVLITFLQAAHDKSFLGYIFNLLDALVDSSVRVRLWKKEARSASIRWRRHYLLPENQRGGMEAGLGSPASDQFTKAIERRRKWVY
jgi:hypothetical protein